jgi:hypothetical protein
MTGRIEESDEKEYGAKTNGKDYIFPVYSASANNTVISLFHGIFLSFFYLECYPAQSMSFVPDCEIV